MTDSEIIAKIKQWREDGKATGADALELLCEIEEALQKRTRG